MLHKRSHHNEKPHMATREQPPLAQPGKSLCRSEDSAQPKFLKKQKQKQRSMVSGYLCSNRQLKKNLPKEEIPPLPTQSYGNYGTILNPDGPYIEFQRVCDLE